MRAGQSHNAPLGEVAQSARGDMSIHGELAVVVATRYRFVVSVSSKSFDLECKQSSFQVHRIYADLGKQSHSSALRGAPALLIASSSKSVANSSFQDEGVSLDSEMHKPLFQDTEDKGQASELADKVLENTGDLNENDQVVEDTRVDMESAVVHPALPTDKTTQSAATPAKKNKP